MLVRVDLHPSKIKDDMDLDKVEIMFGKSPYEPEWNTYNTIQLRIDYFHVHYDEILDVIRHSTFDYLHIRNMDEVPGSNEKYYSQFDHKWLGRLVDVLEGKSNVKDIAIDDFNMNMTDESITPSMHLVIDRLEDTTSVRCISFNDNEIKLYKPKSERNIPIKSKTKSAMKR